MLAVMAAAISVSGCASSAPDNSASQTRDAYTDAYAQGMDQHVQAQSDFDNGTAAWESDDLREAIADYANASMESDAAASCYGIMRGYAGDQQETDFSDSLRGCAYNLSLASDDFMNSAIALQANDSDQANSSFDDGQARLDDSDALLNRSIDLTPEWLADLAASDSSD